MAALTADVKLFIVQALACFDAPKIVAEAVKQQFGITVSPQQLQAYNPATMAGARMSAKLKTIFAETRKRFVEDVSTIPIANQAYRLRVLDRTLSKVEGQGNTAMVAQLLEQAAKESGGVFTNKTKLEHSGSVATPELKLVLHGTAPTPPAV